jgi:thiosulfate reductase / polysulfide reductase chain A
MCTVRCPIQVEVTGDKIDFLQGNPHAAGLEGGLCARGEGQWRRVSWDEALDYTADRLKGIMARHGSKSVLFSDRGGPFRDLHQAFVRGLGSPNYSNHDSSCARNVMHAAQSLFGFGRKDVVYDLKNARHRLQRRSAPGQQTR